MSCPAVEYGKALAASNSKRLTELVAEIKRAGVVAQLNEIIRITYHPDTEYSARLRRIELLPGASCDEPKS